MHTRLLVVAFKIPWGISPERAVLAFIRTSITACSGVSRIPVLEISVLEISTLSLDA